MLHYFYGYYFYYYTLSSCYTASAASCESRDPFLKIKILCIYNRKNLLKLTVDGEKSLHIQYVLPCQDGTKALLLVNGH